MSGTEIAVNIGLIALTCGLWLPITLIWWLAVMNRQGWVYQPPAPPGTLAQPPAPQPPPGRIAKALTGPKALVIVLAGFAVLIAAGIVVSRYVER